MADKSQPDFSSGAAWMRGQIIPISEAMLPVTDWGLTRSDITYDVVHVWKGSFFRLDDYLDRFEKSVASLRLEIPQSRNDIKKILHEMVAKSELKDAYVSMVASRGTPSVPGTRDPRLCSNHFYAWAVPFVWVIPPDIAKRGAYVKISETSKRISPSSVDPTVKNYHWGDMTRALFEALDDGFDTAVLLDEQGLITEGPGFNIFAIVDGKLLTPKDGMLEGITRKTVMEIGEEMGLAPIACDIPEQVFLSADEVFTATTAGGPVSVTRVNERILGNDAPGSLTKQIIHTYWDWHKRAELNEPVDYQK
ncbi:MAG: aminotransferase class IV [Rhizobiaceae bacterium]|nr:aminotransferase class IV [Rhizobiaceae bacterium]